MGVIVLDGALGTLLEQRGVPTPAPSWSAWAVRHAPDAVARIHRAYADAGATVHTAATFRTTPSAVGADAEALTRAAVALARHAVPVGHQVAGSLAPVADCWRPDLSPPDAGVKHAEQADRLARASVDLILVETFAHVGEAVLATRAAAATGLPVWTALTPGFLGDLLPPDALAEGALAVAEAGAAAVLVNCLPARRATPWVAALAATGLPFGVYANARPPEDGLVHGLAGAAEAYAALAREWVLHGARIVGGCCGTGPAHTAAVADLAGTLQVVDGPSDGS